MIKIKGKYTEAKVFTTDVDEGALEQVQEMCDTKYLEGSKIRMMPDIHKGKGCTIGTTMTITDKIVPNHVGVDIGCGVLTVALTDTEIDYEKLDKVIKEHVPNGKSNYEKARYESDVKETMFTLQGITNERINQALGTLGGGNHFIELSKNSLGMYYLTVHTGSRYVGHKVATEHQKIANTLYKKTDIKSIVEKMKKEGRHKEIQKELEKVKSENEKLEGQDYLTGKEMEDYLKDLALAQKFAKDNRKKIVETIVDEMGLKVVGMFDTVHNYLDLDRMILRKGAVRAEKGEYLVIPINMRDGTLLCKGKGNEDWNYSAPHGAGRVLSRTQARKDLDLAEFHKQMEGIYTSSVSYEVLDEAPKAYKSIDSILGNIEETVQVVDILKPVYNFKAKEPLAKWQK